jgi:hypothetical protein
MPGRAFSKEATWPGATSRRAGASPARAWVNKNLQGGSWTRNQYGGARDGTGVCLDICGRDGGCFGRSSRRRTDSNPSFGDDLMGNSLLSGDLSSLIGERRFFPHQFMLRVVSGQWGARTVPAGAAVSFRAAPAIQFYSLPWGEAMETAPADPYDRLCE